MKTKERRQNKTGMTPYTSALKPIPRPKNLLTASQELDREVDALKKNLLQPIIDKLKEKDENIKSPDKYTPVQMDRTNWSSTDAEKPWRSGLSSQRSKVRTQTKNAGVTNIFFNM